MEKKIEPTDSVYPTHGYDDGMDIRTKFALEFAKIYVDSCTLPTPKQEIAEHAVAMADALIKRLNNG